MQRPLASTDFWLLVFVLSYVCPALGQSTVPTPPFHQCPPVGDDTSCAILILIDTTGSLRVFSDPSQGPFDGIEDTLIGVQNNSTHAILSIPLSSAAPIFGFDGDGICPNTTGSGSGSGNGGLSGCPFGPTGYEGPSVSFSNSSRFSGIVNFIGGLPPNKSAYFALEGAISTQCQPISAPTGLKQGAPSVWAGDFIDHTTVTIAEYGCYITSSAMMINYHASKQGSSFTTDPRQLNQYLTAHNGFDANGNVKAGGEALIAQYARANGVNLFYSQMVDHRDDFTLDQYLCNGEPPLLYVANPHWALATGQTTVAGNATYSVLDPDSYPNGSTLQGFGYTYGGMDLYTDIVGPLQALYIRAHSPIGLVLTDPSGAQTGFNPLTGTQLDAIPQSGYQERFLADDQNHSGPATPAVKVLTVVGAIDGSYTLQVIGSGVGPYSIDTAASDTDGVLSTNTVAGSTIPGSVAKYTIGYSSASGSKVTVTQVLTIADLTADVQLASQQGLIKNLGIANSLLQKLQGASAQMAAGNAAAAVGILKAFANEVSAQSGKLIESDASALLVASANALIQDAATAKAGTQQRNEMLAKRKAERHVAMSTNAKHCELCRPESKSGTRGGPG